MTGAQDIRIGRNGRGEVIRQVDGYVHTAAPDMGGRHRVRLTGSAAVVAEDWMSQRSAVSGYPEVVVEGRLFTPPDGGAYMLVEFIRFVGTRNLNLRYGNYPAQRRQAAFNDRTKTTG